MKRARLWLAVLLLALGSLAAARATRGDYDPRVPATIKLVTTATQTATTAVVMSVTFGSSDTTLWAKGITHSTSSNTSRLTILYAGKYTVIAFASFAANATGQRRVSVTQQDVNNNVIDLGVWQQQTVTTASEPTNMTVAQTFNCAVGDFLTMSVFQNSTGNLNLAAGSSLSASIRPRQ